jgi:pyridoxamine 5'-phosphate oxidase
MPNDFTTRDDPFALFAEWLKEAEASEPNDPTAMSVATVDETGLPDVRAILLKGHDPKGFVFYTNFESDKGRQLLGQAKAALRAGAGLARLGRRGRCLFRISPAAIATRRLRL